MRSLAIIIITLIAAVTVNCYVKTVNVKSASDTLAVPHIDALLPPFQDVHDGSKDAAKTTPATTTTTTTTRKTTTTTTTTKRDIAKNVDNNLPELSIEALLPPLLEVKIGKEDIVKTTTTTRRPTTRRPTTTTTNYKSSPTTVKPYKTTTLKPPILKVPDLLLDALVPPLLTNDTITKVKGEENKLKTTTTTPKPIKTTTNFYYQQHTTTSQDDVHKKNSQNQQLTHLKDNNAGNEVEIHKKPTVATNKANDKHIAESQIHSKQVSLMAQKQQHNNIKIDTTTEKYVAKHTDRKKEYNYSFDFYLGSTTTRSPKGGLPTITPFPHRLGG